MNGSHEGETSSVEGEGMASGLESMIHENQLDAIIVEFPRQPVLFKEVADIFYPAEFHYKSQKPEKKGKQVCVLSGIVDFFRYFFRYYFFIFLFFLYNST